MPVFWPKIGARVLAKEQEKKKRQTTSQAQFAVPGHGPCSIEESGQILHLVEGRPSFQGEDANVSRELPLKGCER